MHSNANVPKSPLNINNGIFLPHGFSFLFLIIIDVIDRLNTDLKNTNSYIGILLSIFFTHTVIRLKKIEASIKLDLTIDL